MGVIPSYTHPGRHIRRCIPSYTHPGRHVGGVHPLYPPWEACGKHVHHCTHPGRLQGRIYPGVYLSGPLRGLYPVIPLRTVKRAIPGLYLSGLLRERHNEARLLPWVLVECAQRGASPPVGWWEECGTTRRVSSRGMGESYTQLRVNVSNEKLTAPRRVST